MFTAMCLIRDGFHIVRGPDCPHDRTEDELGEIQPAGWTVQSVTNLEEQQHG